MDTVNVTVLNTWILSFKCWILFYSAVKLLVDQFDPFEALFSWVSSSRPDLTKLRHKTLLIHVFTVKVWPFGVQIEILDLLVSVELST